MTGGWFTAGNMSRRVGFALVFFALLGAAFVPWPIKSQPVIDALDRSLPGAGTMSVAARGRAHFTLLPVPAVRLRDLQVSHRDFGTMAVVPQLAVRMRLLPLIAGSLQINDIIAFDARADATPAARARWVDLLSDRNETRGRTAVTLARGTLDFGQDAKPLTGINGTLEINHHAGEAAAWGNGIWNGQSVQLQASGFQTDRSAIQAVPSRLSIQTPYGSVTASGEASGVRGDGTMQLTIQDASALARWLGASVPLAGIVEQFSLSGAGTVHSRGIQLTDATFSFGPNILKGTMAIALRPGERPMMTGTLATDSIELNAIAGAFDAVQDSAGSWSSDQFDTTSLLNTDLDVRVSAARARVMKMTLTDAALSASLKNGRLDLALGRSSAYGGTLRARATIARLDDANTEQKIQANFENVDFGKFSDAMFGLRLLSGSLTGQVQAESNGNSPQGIVRAVHGRSAMVFKQGELTGISLAETLRRAEREPAQPVAMQVGATRFDTATLNLAVQNGVATVTEGTIGGVGTQAMLAGHILLASREFRLSGAVQHPLRPKQWPFEITGPWAKPVTQTMPQTTTQRSDPASAGSTRSESRS